METYYGQMRLFQNFSFWNSFLRFSRKTELLAGFSKSLSKTNRVLEQAQITLKKAFLSPGNLMFPGGKMSWI
jgi:hypothetical protein